MLNFGSRVVRASAVAAVALPMSRALIRHLPVAVDGHGDGVLQRQQRLRAGRKRDEQQETAGSLHLNVYRYGQREALLDSGEIGMRYVVIASSP